MNKIKQHWIRIFNILLPTLGTLMITSEAFGQGGLAKTKGVLETFKTELTTIIPVVGTIALILLGIGYAMRAIEGGTFLRWAAGVIIAGTAGQITAMLFSGV